MYFNVWREDLALLLNKFDTWHTTTKYFYLKVLIFFLLINDIAYWFAIATTYSEIFEVEKELFYYTKVQIPVALLGSLFDSLSLYLTLFVIRHALISKSNLSYIFHLSIDLLIAIAATFWVLFVFSISGWIIKSVTSAEETIVIETSTTEPVEK